MPQQIPALADRLKALGFAGDAKSFADLTGFPLGAIVSLGGCSASFVSSEGLIVRTTTASRGRCSTTRRPERNLMVDGFLAKTKAEELWNGPGSRVYVTVSVRDVTDAIMGTSTRRRPTGHATTSSTNASRRRQPRVSRTASVARWRRSSKGLKWYEIGQLEIQDSGWSTRRRPHRHFRRRDGQLAVAAPHRRFFLLPGLRLEGWPGRSVLQGQRALPAEAVPQGSPKGASPGELVFVAGYRAARIDCIRTPK